MADSVELRMSVTSIKRVDPYVKDILATATHVALYIFNTQTNEWEKTNTEGALFIYSRNGEPYHSMMVMNRLNTDNAIEPIVKDFDYQMQVPFLLYRNSKSKIFGIWFFNREECIRITFLIESLMEGLKDKNDERSNRKESNVDIFTMLSKAQEDFNRTPTKQDNIPAAAYVSTPRVPDVTSQSVMDFFAKASTKTSQNPTVGVAGNGENVLQRLMSNPAHSVEHIEKQQRSITPQEQINIRQRLNTANADRRSVPVSFPEKKLHSENGFPVSASPLQFLIQNQNQGAQNNTTEKDDADLLRTSPFAQFLEGGSSKPTLMTPMMFSTSKSKDGNNSDERIDQLDLLTEKQLAQALIYLLKITRTSRSRSTKRTCSLLWRK
ncbi:unnamed protein product [Acanthoscelides obtectus]|uniref:mRNA-decapping enzyme C-terminal domain-containing protein n=1 Tax=Acanthoscelides obtectus TaxID=200917 RepID=A0A9P0L2S9_ACAOB|nr:unnamed protein product [Acanthoscelides obtectus]CAK1620395.1 mRNA-decapping enzyme 1B [Acanthoscelides obtectus]